MADTDLTKQTKKMRVSFFVSGGGSVIECAYNFLGLFPDEIEVPLVIFDSEKCAALEKLKKYDINYRVINKGWKNEREKVCNEIRDLCLEHEVDYIFMAFNKILVGDILKVYDNRIINTHLSLLPSFKGLHSIDDAVAYGCQFVGATTHLIDENLDEGLIISQGLVPFDSNEDIADIRNRHYQMLKKLVINTLYGVVKDSISVSDSKVVLAGANYASLPVNPCFEDPIIDEFLNSYPR